MGIITSTGCLRGVSAFKSLYFIAFSNLGQNRFVTKVSQLWICKLFFIYLSLPASLPSPSYQCSKLFRRKLNRYVSTKGQRIFLFLSEQGLNMGGFWIYIFYLFISRVCFSILVISIESSGVWCVEEFKLRSICGVNFQWHLLLFTFYYCQCFSNFECQSINLFQVLNWYILTFDNKCAQKQFYCEIYVICKIQTIFNIDSFVLFVIQTEVLCQIMKRFLIYLFLQNTTQKQTQSFLFYVVEKNTSSIFNDLFIKCSSCLRSALYFLITVNLFNMSIIDLFPQLNEIQIWPTTRRSILGSVFITK